MPFIKKTSQRRDTRFTSNFPTIPPEVPDGFRAALSAWRDNMVAAIKDDQEAVENALADLRKQIDSLDVSARVTALESSVASLSVTTTPRLISDADVAPSAAIKEAKLALNNPTHSNANDPSADQKAALAGTTGTPSGANRYVTASDSRLSSSDDAMLLLLASDDPQPKTPDDEILALLDNQPTDVSEKLSSLETLVILG